MLENDHKPVYLSVLGLATVPIVRYTSNNKLIYLYSVYNTKIEIVERYRIKTGRSF